ncbi:hypothetical protein JW964_26105 [candidate division KSB1 bacterium]|nr:hypothetical protein [candidate division KSB1 bacterium]
MRKISFLILFLILIFSISLLGQSLNLVCVENGTRIIEFSSSDWNTFQTYFESDNDFESSHYCSHARAPFPHYFIYEFAISAEISALEFDTEVEEIAYPGVSAKDIQIYATDGLDTNYFFITAFVLEQNQANQVFEVQPFKARRLKIEITSNYGQKLFTQLGKVKVWGNFVKLPATNRLIGTWNTTFGELHIDRCQPYLTGCYGEGVFQGSFADRILSFYWAEENQYGIVSAILNQEDDALWGFWRREEGGLEIWSGELITHSSTVCPEEPVLNQLNKFGESLLFNYSKIQLGESPDSSSRNILKGAAKYLANNPARRLLVESYIEGDSTPTAQKALAEILALDVKKYLVQKGIAEARITIKGISEGISLIENQTITGQMLNRRIRLQVQ